jgi:very-short-patch-repair endonuclease
MSSEMPEVRLIVNKLVGKLSRSKAILRSQHIGRALMGLQRFTADTPEVRQLLRQVTERIADSDRTRMTSQAIGDALYGLQGMSSSVNEVQELIGELAKKISATAAVLTPRDMGRALFGLQGLSSSRSLFVESAIGLDSDEVQFLLSALWDKIKLNTAVNVPLASAAMGLQGLSQLRDPIAENLRQFLYVKVISMGNVTIVDEAPKDAAEGSFALKSDVVSAVRALLLSNLRVPKWLAVEYTAIEAVHSVKPVIPQSRGDKMVASRFASKYPQIRMKANALLDGFRLDMQFPDLRLSVELDGPTHGYPARARFDRERDEFLRDRKQYEILRVPLVGQNSNEVIAFIHKKVLERADQIADMEVQRLYSKDEDIQRLYKR